jgi:putative oxidoreductase
MVQYLVHARLVLQNDIKMVYRIIRRGYSLFITCANYLRSPLLLAIRLYFFWQLCETGWGKLHNIEKVTQFFTSLGIPLPGLNAWVVASLECFGMLLLVVGLFTRPISLMIFFSMTAAYLTADMEAFSSIFSDPDKFMKADPFVFWLTSLIIFVFGAGLFSLDALLKSVLRRRDFAHSNESERLR